MHAERYQLALFSELILPLDAFFSKLSVHVNTGNQIVALD